MKNQTHWTKKKLFFLIIEIWLGVFILSVLSVVVALGVFYNTWWYRFKLHAKLTDRTAIELVRTGLNTPVTQENGRKNILLLGTDALANREGDPVLTDTMILFSLNLTNGTLTAISLPRDLWSVEYKTKINSLYEYGKDRYPDEPERFPTEVITQMTNVPVHHTIVLSLDQLRELIDIMGGVTIEISEGFVDEQFPRTDVDIRTEGDPAKLYERIEFSTGTETMSGVRALQYIRSRHSSQLTQGTDNARSIRQQAVINAILLKLRSKEVLQNPVILGQLFDWYQRHFGNTISVYELIRMGYDFQEKAFNLEFHPQTLSFELNGERGVITHPDVRKYNQWVYEVKNEEEFKSEIHQKLGL